jgi:hypothetical protein
MKGNKKLKEEYKNHKPLMGVYQVTNIVTGQRLIEASTDVLAKWNRHQMELRMGSHRVADLQRDWDKQSADDFSFEILSVLEYLEDDNHRYDSDLKALYSLVLEGKGIDPKTLYSI